jgi:hypothetical protein
LSNSLEIYEYKNAPGPTLVLIPATVLSDLIFLLNYYEGLILYKFTKIEEATAK